jgi:hypothetical protein
MGECDALNKAPPSHLDDKCDSWHPECAGDENIVQVEHEEQNSDDGEGSTAGTSVSLIKLPAETDTMRPFSENTTNPLKHPVQRPAKTADQLEREYIDNVSALTDLDEAD